jgi:hypothetical protein
MEKNLAETAERVPALHQSPESGPALERACVPRRKKARGEHCLNVYVSYELKERLSALSERYGLSLADIIRQTLKAGIPVFESLTASQDELIDGYVQLLRENRIIGELKK